MTSNYLDPGTIIFFLILYILVTYWIAKAFQSVCKMKGYNSLLYFWICMVVPLAGWILVAALPVKEDMRNT